MDVRSIIADHQALHDHLDDEDREAWDRDMKAHLEGIFDEVGIDGVAMLIHIALELAIVYDEHPGVLGRALAFVEAYLPQVLLIPERPDGPQADLGAI